MSDVVGVALDEVPIEYRERFEGLLQEKPQAIARLRQQVASYLTVVRQIGRFVALFKRDDAEALGRSCEGLLTFAEPLAAGDPRRRLVQAAVQYFILEEEDEEVTGVLGFDDDIQVMNAACRALERPDLVIPWRPEAG